MPVRTEISLRLPNSPGALGAVAQALARERIQVFALSLDGAGLLRMIVEPAGRGAAVLRDEHRQVEARDVLVVAVANEIGAFASALALVSDAGFNVDYAYAAGVERGGATLVLGVADAMRAATAAGV